MKTGKPSDYALGVMVTDRALHGVLVQRTPDGPGIVRQMIRQRNARAVAMQPGLASVVPELQDDPSSDFTISFGDGSSNGSDLFLASEFSGLDGARALQMDDGNGAGGSESAVQSFELELSEIIEECEQLGYPDPQIGLCLGSSDLVQVTLTLVETPVAQQKGKAKKKKQTGEDGRLSALTEQYHGDVDKERVAFIPMLSNDDGDERCLAIAARRNDGIAATLKQFREMKDQRMPAFRVLDAESALLLAIARAAIAEKEEADKTSPALVLRPGPEDTLVIFLLGSEIQHCESMRSLTAFDSPETICSRVLLQQDEFGFGDIGQIFVLSEEREQDLIGSLEMFFPEARVESLRGRVAERCSLEKSELRNAEVIPAVAVALRLVGGASDGLVFEQINLLPRKLVRKQLRLPLSWPQLVLFALLFATAFFFTARYFVLANQISDRREKLNKYPLEFQQGDPKQLQARIDSMQAVYKGYMRALDVIDSLLVGSDQWSRGLERVSRAQSAARGGWVEKWTPKDGAIELVGSATTRDQIVRVAQRLDGDIQSLTFAEIREWPVYTYTMVIPNKQELPQAAKYLRDQAAAKMAAEHAKTDRKP